MERMDASMSEVIANQLAACEKRPNDWFQENTILAFIHHMASGVAYLHGNQMAHRDVKLENFLVEFSGLEDVQRIVVTDFGTARVFAADDVGTIQAQTLAGTPAYFAPEEFQPTHNPMRADVWAFGIAVFVMIAGEAPSEEQLGIIHHGSLDDADECRPQLTKVVNGALDAALMKRQALWKNTKDIYERCTARDPHHRVDLKDVAAETEQYAASLPGLMA